MNYWLLFYWFSPSKHFQLCLIFASKA